MARIRTIKPEFWTSGDIMNLSRDARLMFIGLWNFCDDAGNHVSNARTIRAEIFPGDDDIGSATVRRLLEECSANNLISFYEAGGRPYIHVNGWRHQKIERPNIKHPPMSTGNQLDAPRFADQSPTNRRLIADPSPPEGKGREGKVIGKEITPPDIPPLLEIETEVVATDSGQVVGMTIREFSLLYHQTFRKLMPPGLNHAASECCARYPPDWIRAAFETAAASGAQHFNFVKQVLERKVGREMTDADWAALEAQG